jgi:hypothetical protein
MDDCSAQPDLAELMIELATFSVLAKGDLDADAALAFGVGWRRRRGR